MEKLNKNSKLPLYLQLKEILLKQIEQDMTIGTLIPTETEIEATYGVSRMTVRKTVDELVNDGYLIRKQGKGTFVKDNKTIQDVGRIFSWTEEMQSQQRETKTTHMEIKRIEPSKRLRTALNLSKNEKLICINRVREINSEPIVIMLNYLREKYVPGLLEHGIESDSLYKDLEEKYDLILLNADEVITSRLSDPTESLLLNIPEDSAVLHVRRTSYIKNKIPVEVVDMVARGDKYQYFAKLKGRQKRHSL